MITEDKGHVSKNGWLERTKWQVFGLFAMSLVKVSGMYQTAVKETYWNEFLYFWFSKNILLKAGGCKESESLSLNPTLFPASCSLHRGSCEPAGAHGCGSGYLGLKS